MAKGGEAVCIVLAVIYTVPNCQNKHIWDIHSGIKRSVEDICDELLNNTETNCTWIGGEPTMQAKAFTKLSKLIKSKSNKTIWLYSGHTYEKLIQNVDTLNLLKECDVLVDGRWIEELKDTQLCFRNSSNQRIIDVKSSLKKQKIILWERR